MSDDSPTGLDRAPTRYTAHGRETIDRQRDAALTDAAFADLCFQQALRYEDRLGLKDEEERDRAKANFYRTMARHVIVGDVPDPRSGRPGFVPYERPPLCDCITARLAVQNPEAVLFEPREVYDLAIVGLAYERIDEDRWSESRKPVFMPVAVYDSDLLVEATLLAFGVDEESEEQFTQAVEHVEVNMIGSWIGEHTPIVIRLPDEDDGIELLEAAEDLLDLHDRDGTMDPVEHATREAPAWDRLRAAVERENDVPLDEPEAPDPATASTLGFTVGDDDDGYMD